MRPAAAIVWLIALGPVTALGQAPSASLQTTAPCSPIVVDTRGNVDIDINCPIQLTPKQLRELIDSLRSPEGLGTELVSEFRELSGQFRVTELALKTFLRTLDRKQVPIEDLDATLRQVAKRHLDLIGELQRLKSASPDIAAIKQEALKAIEEGDYGRAEALLRKAENADLAAARALQEEAELRLLSAGETRAERGGLQLTQLNYLAAGKRFQEAAELVPPDHDLVRAGYLNRAGVAFHDAGKYEQASEPLEEALAIRENYLGPEHPSVGTSLNNLALLYEAQGRYAEAEPLLERALRIMEKALGPNHPSTVTVRGNLEVLRRKSPGGADQ